MSDDLLKDRKTVLFSLDVEEVESLLAFHLSKDEDDKDSVAIDDLWQAALELGGDPLEIERMVTCFNAIEAEAEDETGDDPEIDHLADVIGALVGMAEVQTDFIAALDARVKALEVNKVPADFPNWAKAGVN